MASSAASESDVDATIFPFQDLRPGHDPFHPYKGRRDNEESIIVIDNGSFNIRMGWHLDDDPLLVYKPLLARTRKEKGKDSELLVANDLVALDAFRFNVRTPFDRHVVTQFESMETLLDYGFAHLGLNEVGEEEQGRVRHPVVLTEPMANPNLSRALMSELIFECYDVPKVCYGVDALFSQFRNACSRTCLIISLGFQSVHFMPVIDGVTSSEGIKRLNLGGFNLTAYLQRAIQLKYPTHLNSITVPRAEEMLQNHCHVVTEYTEELKKWSREDYYTTHVRKMQLPFTPAPRPPPADPEALRQRRQELAKRLVQMNQKKREEKLVENENLLRSLQTCTDLYEQGYEDKVKRILNKYGLANTGIRSAQDLSLLIQKTKEKIDKAKAAIDRKKREDAMASKEQESGNVKAGRKRKREDMDEDERRKFDQWILELKEKRESLLERRQARRQRRQQLAQRRTAASQERMRIISQLAKHSKKGHDDDFGSKDEDWDVYKKISKDVGDSDSEEEQVQLAEYESLLKENDPEFALAQEGQAEVSQDSPEWFQLHMATERIRVPEILFQPSILGHDQAGLSETVEFILKKYPAEIQDQLAENVFLTGALARLPGLRERLERDLTEMRPFRATSRVRVADNPSLDAWRGASLFARDSDRVADSFISRQEYLEKGGEYLKEHQCSNKYFVTPAPSSA